MSSLSNPVTLIPNWKAKGAPFRHSWAGHLNVDQFRWLVRADLQQHLAQARAEIGGRHVRAVGMFDDELRVLRPGPETFGKSTRKPRLNWQVVDAAIDALLARGLRPIFTTTFVPSVLASGSTTVFTTQGVTSPPRNYAAWGRLVEAAVRHQVERHGLSEVRRWYFEAWNEPNLKGWFWDGTQADFFRLWRFTYRAIKRVDRGLRVGGPSTGRAEWLEEFLAYGRAHRCTPDHLALHIYNNDGTTAALAPFDGIQKSKVSVASDLAVSVIRERTARARALGFRGEIHWNEWGRSWRPCEPERETPLEAAFIVRTLSEISQTADVFSYWCLSDIYDQVGYGRETFHGNYGLLNLQGLRKPAYHAFQLLGRLGRRRLPVSASEKVDVIATRTATGWQVLVALQGGSDRAHSRAKVRIKLPPGADEASV
ncbi:MAG: hypothetical protein JNN01_01230, partial [Opitutaceae bacterium]|nr:hypothetical protein [Opitutaceae bacterium]